MFRGRPLESVTEYEYDDAGRLVRARSFHEAEVTVEDQAEMLALQVVEAREADVCPCGCGQPRQLAWDENNDDHFEVPDDLPVCQARVVMDRWEKDNPPDGRNPGVVPHVVYTGPDPAD